MWLRRLLALVAAIGLVVGAIVIRSRLDHKDAGAASPGPSSGPSTGGSPGGTQAPAKATVPAAIRLVCIPELQSVCQAAAGAASNVTVTTASADATAIKLGGADDPAAAATAWVTLEPWPAIVDSARARASEPRPTAFASTTPIGRSPVGIAVRAERAGALASACGGTITWRCVGENAGKSWAELGGQATWGKLTPAHANPTTNATGLVTLAAAVVQYVGRADIVAVDLANDDTFQSWVQRFERAIPAQIFDDVKGSPLDQSLRLPIADVIAVTEAEVTSVGAANASRVVTTYPAPTAAAIAVVAAAAGVALPSPLVDALTKAAGKAGWKPPSTDPSGLPSATTMEALQLAWKTWR